MSQKLIVGDCRLLMPSNEIPENSVDLIVTSPPYNCKIPYDSWDDERPAAEYYSFMEEWLRGAYKVLKDDGRIALNCLIEVNFKERGGRFFNASEVWRIMERIGFHWAGVIDLTEEKSHRVKYCAWGSWMSASAPYVYNPKECIIVAYKKRWKKSRKGESDMSREEFMELMTGIWTYHAEMNGKTPATFSLDIPIKSIKILSLVGDTVLDPFCGRGTTGAACKILGRNFIGVDISSDYIAVAHHEIDVMSSRDDVTALMNDMKSRKIMVINPPLVKDYITMHPKLISPIWDVLDGLRVMFDTSNTVFVMRVDDDDSDDICLALYVRQVSYDEDIMDKIHAIMGKVDYNTSDSRGGYLFVTSDFQSVLGVP